MPSNGVGMARRGVPATWPDGPRIDKNERAAGGVRWRWTASESGERCTAPRDDCRPSMSFFDLRGGMTR